jgi:peptide chain release factor 2
MVLDTHVLLWLDRDDAQLGHQARKTIAQAWERCQVAVSVISFWEASPCRPLHCRQRDLAPRHAAHSGSSHSQLGRLPGAIGRAPLIRSDHQKAIAVNAASTPAAVPLDLTDFKRDLSELTDRLGHAQDCL